MYVYVCIYVCLQYRKPQLSVVCVHMYVHHVSVCIYAHMYVCICTCIDNNIDNTSDSNADDNDNNGR